jgi:hypothetical protein
LLCLLESRNVTLAVHPSRRWNDSSQKRLFITFFDSREALDAAEAGFDAMGDTIPEEVRGRRTSVAVYEVAYEGAV